MLANFSVAKPVNSTAVLAGIAYGIIHDTHSIKKQHCWAILCHNQHKNVEKNFKGFILILSFKILIKT